MEPKEFVQEVKRLLKARSGKTWSVTYESHGTAYDWVKIGIPPARCIYDVDAITPWTGAPLTKDRVGCPSKAEMQELAQLLGMDRNEMGVEYECATGEGFL
jgi:hypothetical protein